jgi:hypothetical protein
MFGSRARFRQDAARNRSHNVKREKRGGREKETRQENAREIRVRHKINPDVERKRGTRFFGEETIIKLVLVTTIHRINKSPSINNS